MFVLTLVLLATAAPAAASTSTADRALDHSLEQLVNVKGGPPGASAVIQRGHKSAVHTAGVAKLGKRRPIHLADHMRIASMSKAFVGATALVLVDQGKLSTSTTIGERVPGMPAAWSRVTLGELLSHTSGLPDYSASKAFQMWLVQNLHATISPRELINFVAAEPLEFTPGTSYQYSNTDNIVAGLMVEAVTGTSYEHELQSLVLAPLGLEKTTLPSGWQMPKPFVHGYDFDPPQPPEDVSELASMSSLWAAGGIVSTPADVNHFIRGDVGRRLFSAKVQRQQFHFVTGESQPPGPGKNSAGLAVFRYRTACGTLYGHTGNVFGYTQLMAASRDRGRSLVVSVNTQLARGTGDPQAFSALRQVFEDAACAALG